MRRSSPGCSASDQVVEAEEAVLTSDPEAAMDTSNIVVISRHVELCREVVAGVAEQVGTSMAVVVNDVASQKLYIPCWNSC